MAKKSKKNKEISKDEGNDYRKWDSQTPQIPEDVWRKEDYFLKKGLPNLSTPDTILQHTCGDIKVVFGISQPEASLDARIIYESWSLKENTSYVWHGNFNIKGGLYTAYDIVDNTIKHFDEVLIDEDKLESYLIKQIKHQNDTFDIKTSQHIETAQRTGYVQGVCESVLAFNNDENRKIMTEAAMTFLSKKLLSEMNVTKDMAQKFANPETYKALEQSVFAPKQEHQLEQTQTHGREI
jgi:hypothetical protein